MIFQQSNRSNIRWRTLRLLSGQGERRVPNQEKILQQIQCIRSETSYLIRLLYLTNDYCLKSLTLNQLWNKLDSLWFLLSLLEPEPSPSVEPPPQIPLVPSAPLVPSEPQVPSAPLVPSAPPASAIPSVTFSTAQLAQYTGREGAPAYVAVNGIVYDVTNVAAWSTGTHFALTAGKDLSQAFSVCHPAQQGILNQLKMVGRFVP